MKNKGEHRTSNIERPISKKRAQEREADALFERYCDLGLLQRDAAACHFFGGLRGVFCPLRRKILRRAPNYADVLHAFEMAVEAGKHSKY